MRCIAAEAFLVLREKRGTREPAGEAEEAHDPPAESEGMLGNQQRSLTQRLKFLHTKKISITNTIKNKRYRKEKELTFTSLL